MFKWSVKVWVIGGSVLAMMTAGVAVVLVPLLPVEVSTTLGISLLAIIGAIMALAVADYRD